MGHLPGALRNRGGGEEEDDHEERNGDRAGVAAGLCSWLV